jgi:hypothetical protein
MEKDMVYNPPHYTQGKIECLAAIEAAVSDKKGIEAVYVANIIKYLWRYRSKDGLTALKKAGFYLDRLISYIEKEKT